jgi:hypothetical protein
MNSRHFLPKERRSDLSQCHGSLSRDSLIILIMAQTTTRRPRLLAHVGEGGLGQTDRRDHWWLQPAGVALGLAVFIAYSTWAALSGEHYAFGPYLSPFYSPDLRIPGIRLSPALLVLWAPLGFRMSCYYYRKVYYRAFYFSPPACAVSEPVRTYRGEAGVLRWLPIVHRWFLYASIVVLLVLWYDALRAFNFDGHLGVGLGSIVLLLNAAALSFFTFGCHALRSAVGGNERCFGCSVPGRLRYRSWRTVSFFTARHPFWAWASLFTVALADLYIRLLSIGVLHDPRALL